MPTMMTRPHTVETHFKAGGHFDSASLPAPAKSRIQKQLAQLPEIVDHILRHHGPDEGRSAHPDRIRIHVLVLEEALQIAKRHGLHEGLSPIHFEQVEGIWENDKYVKEVRNKVVHHLFSTHFKESLGSLISGLTSELYHEPFTEVLDGLPHLIRPSSACSAGGDSSSKLVREYLVSVGRSELAQALRSFHFCQSPKGEAMRQDEFDELVKKKGDFLFSVSFHGSMQRMIEGLSAHAIRAPLTDRVCGVDVIARCSVLLRELKTSEGFLQRYFDLRPELRVAGICRHHIGRPGRGVVSRQETNDSIVINRGNAILYGKYDGRLDHFLREISAIDLFGGEVEESIDGLCLKTKLAAVKERFSSNVFDTVVCYLGLTDRLKELPGLRSYHLPRISTNSFDDPEIAEEILAKKIAQMIEGSGKSAAEIVSTLTSEAIRTPLIDRIGEFEFVVSTHAAFKEVS